MLMCFDVNEHNGPLRVPEGPPCSCCCIKIESSHFLRPRCPRVTPGSNVRKYSRRSWYAKYIGIIWYKGTLLRAGISLPFEFQFRGTRDRVTLLKSISEIDNILTIVFSIGIIFHSNNMLVLFLFQVRIRETRNGIWRAVSAPTCSFAPAR